ncbi:MAG: MFS transporter [Deltaproteobacteria bacterium]|nr:MFS transporter [Deltaproteobacteria bacterium]MBW2359664.1 MFS transporter [Deltaproteobacteria bacterium]
MSTRPFLGWRVVAAAFTAQLLSNGCTFAVFGVFVVPLSQAFDVSEGRFGLGLSFTFLVMGAMGPLVGRWIDRGLARPLMLAGVVATGCGMLALSRAAELWQLAFAFCGIVGVGTACFGPTPSMGLVANWFVRRRGLALGLTVAGATVATWIAPPVAAYLIDSVGWRAALAWFGAGALTIGIPVFWFCVVGRPESVGQRPDGDAPLAEAVASPPAEEVATGSLLRDARLWLLSVGFGLVFTSPIVIVLVLVPFGEQLGFSRQNAAFFFSAMAPFSLLGKVVFGALADRVPAHLGIWIVVLGSALVWGLLYANPSYGLFLGIGALYGVAIGAAGPLQGVIIGRCFGRAAFGRVYGIGGLATVPIIAAAPAIAGVLRDATGSYNAVFLFQIVVLLLGGALLAMVRIPKHAES